MGRGVGEQAYSAKNLNSQGWTRPKLGAYNSIKISYMGAGAQDVGASIASFPRILAGTWIGIEADSS